MKKLLATLLASTMALTAIGGLVACGDGGEGSGAEAGLKPADFSKVTHLDDPLLDKEDETNAKVAACTISVWAPAEIIPTFEAMMETFKSADYHEGKYADVTVNFEAKEEGKVQDALGTDASVAASADLFFFPSDHTGNMIRNNWLLPLRGATGSYYSAAVMQRDDKGCTDVVNQNGYAYAFPATNDNGYYLVYNKSDLTEDEADNLDTILAKAEEKEKKFVWDYGSGYYLPTFFFGTGVELDMRGPKSKFDSFNSPEAELGAKAMIKYINNSNIIKSTGNGSSVKGIMDGEVIAGFCGTWEAPTEEQRNAGVGLKKLPMFTVNADNSGTKYQMGGFYGGKYCGINSNTKNAAVAMAVANYLTNSAAQLKRFEVQQTGPSNKTIAAREDVQNNPSLKAYLAQATAGGVAQGDIMGSYWSGIQTYADDISNGKVTLTNLGLANLVKAMAGMLEAE
ncbi:MAG: extracellular solute-binding protein [Clostridiales bacterium]|nr:extracellular solute-binding protein [Clostridiales bacterium]